MTGERRPATEFIGEDEEMTDEKDTDETVQNAIMELLEIKLASFLSRADLSDSPPQDKVAIRAAYFLGISAGLSLGRTFAGSDGEAAAAALDDQKVMVKVQAE